MHESYITCDEMDLSECEDTDKDALKTKWFFTYYTKIFYTFHKFLAVPKEKGHNIPCFIITGGIEGFQIPWWW